MKWANKSGARNYSRFFFIRATSAQFWVSDAGREARETRFTQAYAGFYNIFSRPYWTRMWTYQEIWMARRDPTIICGDLECSLRSVGQGATSITFIYLIVPERIHRACTQATVGGTNAADAG